MYIGFLISAVYAVGFYIIIPKSIEALRIFTPKAELKELGPTTALAPHSIATFLGLRTEADDDVDSRVGTGDAEARYTADEVRQV